MADVISDTEQVKAVVQGVSAWMPVISTLGGGVLAGGVALLVSRMNHRYAREREATAAAERLRHEQQLAEDKQQKEFFYIATELIFLLEQYAEGCTQVANDDGWNGDHHQSEAEPHADYPKLNLADVTGDWRVMDLRHMYRIRELPVLQNEAQRVIAHTRDIPDPPNHEFYFRERQYQFTRLGLKAVIMAERLRRVAGLPRTRLADGEWSAVAKLGKVWRHERRRRAAVAILRMQWGESILPGKDNKEGLTS